MKTQKEILKHIERTNAAYQAATRLERIVMVCKDAVKMLEDGLIEAYQGSIIRYDNEKFNRDSMNFNSELSQENILDTDNLKSLGCNVCAKGACLLAKQRVGNQLNKNVTIQFNSSSGTTTSDLLKDVFNPIELDALEVVFEMNVFHWTKGWAREINEYKYELYNTSTQKLIAIYKDVIANGGVIDLELFS